MKFLKKSTFSLGVALLISANTAYSQTCPVLINYSVGNGGAGTCPGVSSNPISSNFTGTQYATVPVSAKTGDFTTEYATSQLPPVVPAMAEFWQGATRLPDTSGPASPVSTSAGFSSMKYCCYGSVNLPNGGTFTLVFRDPQTDTVMLSCSYTKSGGSIVSASAPTITSQPKSTFGCLGYPATFSVTATPGASGTLTYQWRKNGINISGATSSTYTINAVTTADTGTGIYSVVITENSNIVTTSYNASLLLNKQVVFNGTTSVWNTASNWSNNTIPDSTKHVYIPASATNMPYINSGTVACKCLTIENGATLTVNGATIEIAGRINNNGTFDASNGTVVINGKNIAQTIPAAAFSNNNLRNLTTANTAGVSLAGALNITGTYTPTAGIFATNNFLTLKSTSTSGTARVASGNTSGGYITGNVTTERYIPAATNRAWRLLAPATTGSETIQSAWQEGATSINSNPVATKGTIITCHSTYSTTAGFDAVTPSNSMLAYDATNQSWTSNPVTNTNTKQLASEQGYFIYIRGDRTVLPSSSISGAGSTTLRSTGAIRQGNQAAVPVPAAGFALIGNPYPAPIDFSLISAGDRPNIGNKFWVWDPKLTGSYGLGAYVLFDVATSTPWTPSVSGGSYLTPNSVIPSGMAFFVQSTGSAGSLTLKESHKTSGNSNSGFKGTAGTTEELHIGLTAMKPDTTWAAADGAFILFNTAFADTVDADDAGKPINFGENLGLLRNGTTLALEARPQITTTDTVQIRMWKMKQTKYSLNFTPANIGIGTSAMLFDNYTNDSFKIDPLQKSDYNFIVNTDTASASQTRFYIAFAKAEVESVAPIGNKSSQVLIYPNPTTNNVNIAIQNATPGSYSFDLYNIAGQRILNKDVHHKGGAIRFSITLPASIAPGNYKVITTKDNKHFNTTNLIIR